MITDSKERDLLFDKKYQSVWKWLDNQTDPECSVYMLIKLAQSISANNDWRDTTFKLIDNIVPYKKNKINKTLKKPNKFILFYCKKRGCDATAKYNGDKFIVEKGSKVSSKNLTLNRSGNFPNLKKLITLENENIIDGNGVFTQDYMFTSPSQAGSIVTKFCAVNGRDIWKTKANITIADIYGKATSNK